MMKNIFESIIDFSFIQLLKVWLKFDLKKNVFFRNEERKNAMHSLMKLAVDGKVELWDKHFKPVLLILLETLADDDVSIF